MFIFCSYAIEEVSRQFVHCCCANHVQCRNTQTAHSNLEYLCHEFFVFANHAADTSAASGESLGNGVDDDNSVFDVSHLTEGCHFSAVISEFSVNFVSQNPQIMFFSEVSDNSHVFSGQDAACRVTGVNDRDHFCLICNNCFQSFLDCIFVAFFSVCCNGFYNTVSSLDECQVVCVVGFSYDNFITGVDDGQECQCQRFGTTCCNQNVVSFQIHVESLEVINDCVLQFGQTPRTSVSQYLLVKAFYCFPEYGRCFDIGLTDVQVINLNACCFSCVSHRVKFSNRGVLHCLHSVGNSHVFHFSF